ncbi:hypothetical protein T01_232 [Trichinella spiralis]|uniref:Uncharacterized protein n=1 Tax=Trichinella spiralis TaxID=6334 RepID=A0A0V1BW05_TRISP|nr:hypothetical protein T01_232 [Trichinella spiralis]
MQYDINITLVSQLWEAQKAEIKDYNNRRFKSKDVFQILKCSIKLNIIDFIRGFRHVIFQFHVREDIINCVYP